MPTRLNPRYQRVLLKLSGEALQGQDDPICRQTFSRLATDIQALLKANVQVAIVIGGGNWSRGRDLQKDGVHQHSADQMGMLFTVVNGLALRDLFAQSGIPAEILSSINMPGFVPDYRRDKAMRALSEGKALILCGGTGETLFTTDTAAAQRAIEIEADILLKASTVDGVYDADPRQVKTAQKFTTLDYKRVIRDRLQVMDMAAFCLCEQHAMPIYVFDFNAPGALLDAVSEQSLGTMIQGENHD